MRPGVRPARLQPCRSASTHRTPRSRVATTRFRTRRCRIRQRIPDGSRRSRRSSGTPAPRVERCSVLEVGCNDGSNLIPMAVSLPAARFVGCDLSPRALDVGRRTIDCARTREHHPRRRGPGGACACARRVRLHRCAWRVFVGAAGCARRAVRPRCSNVSRGTASCT